MRIRRPAGLAALESGATNAVKDLALKPDHHGLHLEMDSESTLDPCDDLIGESENLRCCCSAAIDQCKRVP